MAGPIGIGRHAGIEHRPAPGLPDSEECRRGVQVALSGPGPCPGCRLQVALHYPGYGNYRYLRGSRLGIGLRKLESECSHLDRPAGIAGTEAGRALSACAAVNLIAPLKSDAHSIRQLRNHGLERERIVQFESRRIHWETRGLSTSLSYFVMFVRLRQAASRVMRV